MDEPTHNLPEPSDEEIALGAYRLWLQDGCPHGRDREHWLKARHQLVAAKAKEMSKHPEGSPQSGNPPAA